MAEKLELGVMTHLSDEPTIEMKRIADFGVTTCQVSFGHGRTLQQAQKLRQAADDNGVRITTLWAQLPGPAVWNFTEGPITIGIVPPEYRAMRVQTLVKAAQIAGEIGVESITTHAGFIPEYPGDPLYRGAVIALQTVARACQSAGVQFWFETGQETPVTLLRTIQDIGTDNLGINLDTGNLILYGKANPVDAIDVFGEYVTGTHCKDGEYPTDGNNLGVEKPLGEGKANFELIVPKLKALGYTGTLTIEREISGPQQAEDIRMALDLLDKLR